MARKKVESDDVDLDEQRTRPVKVSTVTREEYVKDEPIEVIETGEDDDAQWADPFGAFNEIITTNQQASVRIWRLPNFEVDGRGGIHGTEREYCGSLAYESDDSMMLDKIRGLVPMGGAVQLELYADGGIRKRGLLRLVKAITQPSGYAPQGTHLVINQPAAATQLAPVAAPMTMVEQAESFLKVAEVIKRLQPEQQLPAQSNGTSSEEPKPLEERLFETLALKALESDKVPVDRLLEALSGRRSEPGWMETLVPLGIEAMKLFAPTINALAQRMAAQQQAGVTPGLPQAQLGAAPQEQPGEPVSGQEPPPIIVVDPVQRDWFQTIIRMLEDCTRHVELASVGGGAKSVLPSAEAVLELLERYPEQLGPTIQLLLATVPIEVLDNCAMMLDAGGQAHINNVLKPQPAALKWIEELQTECKRILSEAAEENDTTAPVSDVA